MDKKLTIIVPVFNGEKYIEACLDSLLMDLHDDIEVIVVNDGSTDSTDDIVRMKFRNYLTSGSFTYLSLQNGGVSAARNAGLDKANGEYVAFVDSDDLVCPSYTKTILEALADSPSILEFGYRTIDQDGQVLKDQSFIHTKYGRHEASEVIDTIFSACLWYPFLRVCRKQLFLNTRFPIGVRFCEDMVAFSKIYREAQTIRSLPNVLYEYRINPAGATLNTKLDYATNLIDFYRGILNSQSYIDKALKINLAYTIRGCLHRTVDPLGRLPEDIEADLNRLRWTPKLYFNIRLRFILFALFGPSLFSLKRLLR